MSVETLLEFTRSVSDLLAPAPLAIAAAAAAWLVTGALAAYLWRELRALRETFSFETARLFEQLDLLRLDGRGAIDGMDQVGERLQRLSGSLEERPATGGSQATAYEIASRLATNGATAEQLEKTCGIGRAEARLLVRIQMARTATVAHVSESPSSPGLARR